MKTAHWVTRNQSGMHHVAEAMAEAERRLGHDAAVVDLDRAETWAQGHAMEADIHINHTRFPDYQRAAIRNATGKDPKVVFVSHGIPEHTFECTIVENLHTERYDVQDYWMLHRHCLRTSDAVVVFTDRYKALFETMIHKSQVIDLVPMGVDRAFWSAPLTVPKMKGEPAVWMSENQHRIKWALDVFLAWPFVLRENYRAHLHAHWIPYDQHRFMIDLANTNGAAYGATISAKTFPHDQLRHYMRGCDFMLATTRYGDNTNLTMQAEAGGVPTISYTGNPYASYWMPEGDQRVMAKELLKIFAGDVEPRADKLAVPDFDDMGRAMVAVYERVLS